MKKITCTILAIILTVSIFAIPVFAVTPPNNSIGYMPKMESDEAIVLDGVRDDAYDSARYINVMSKITSSDASAFATAEITWDGTYIYAYVNVLDQTVTSLKDETKPWLSDSVELYLYKGTAVPTAAAVEQYRIDADGNLTYYTNHGDSPTQYFGTELSQFEGVAATYKLFDVNAGYSVEYKIPYSLSVDDNIYFQVAVNNMSENSIEPIVIGNKEASGTWDVSNFDSLICCAPYSELSDISGINADIAAIGTITKENYIEKQSLIEAAINKSDALNEKYGDNVNNSYNSMSLLMDQAMVGFYSEYGNIVFGDLNNDNGITAADALLVLQASVMKIELGEQQTMAGDVNGDYQITAADALLVLQYSVKKVDAFPVDVIFPCVEFAAPILTYISDIQEGFTLDFSSEDLVQKTNTFFNICFNENGLVIVQKVEGNDTPQIRTIINDEGIFVVNMKDKTYTMTPTEEISEGNIDDLFSGLLSNITSSSIMPTIGFGYYNDLPCIGVSLTMDNPGITDIEYEGKITLSANIAAEKDGDIIIAISITGENGEVLMHNEIKNISCSSGIDSSYFEIPSNFTLIEAE